MKSLTEKDAVHAVGSSEEGTICANSEKTDSSSKALQDPTVLSTLTTPFSSSNGNPVVDPSENKSSNFGGYGWARILRRISIGAVMWRLHERFLGSGKADLLNSAGDIWLLGRCYNATSEEPSTVTNSSNGYSAFLDDFSSRILMTYRKGFDVLGESKYTSDVNWGCMIRSSQMLIAQALLFHHLGRSWRKPSQKPYDPKYIEILYHFGDSEECAFSIHNLLKAGKSYGLSPGSWVGPYAMCRAWETLIRTNREHSEPEERKLLFPMVLYIVSGDEDGERGGAPVVCVDVAFKLSSDFTSDMSTWPPILLLVPLVLGLEKVNPRYIPLLKETFTFPQSLGILGGKPATSTYIVGFQDDNALYLDPHEVQPAVTVGRTDLEADTSSFHSSTVRQLSLDQIDSSLAICFYCRDKDEFDDFCSRASELERKANGAPLFTVVQSAQPRTTVYTDTCGVAGDITSPETFEHTDDDPSIISGEDGWQIL